MPDPVPVSASEAAIRLEGVSLRYPGGPAVLSEASFALEEGGFVFLQGAFGAGKSTLLRYLRMELPAESGRGFLFGARSGTGGAGRARSSAPGASGWSFRTSASCLGSRRWRMSACRCASLGAMSARRGPRGRSFWAGSVLPGGRGLCLTVSRAASGSALLLLGRSSPVRASFLLTSRPGSVDAATARRLLHLFLSLQREGTGVLFATHDDALVERLGHPRLCLEGGRAVWRAGAAAGAWRGLEMPDKAAWLEVAGRQGWRGWRCRTG